MEVHIRKSQELKITKGFLGGKNLKLVLEINTSLSDGERALIQKYGDPTIHQLSDLKGYFTQSGYDLLKFDREEPSLSKYTLVAHLDDGFTWLGIIQKLEQAVLTELKNKLAFLQSLGEWEGEKTMVIKEADHE